MKIIEMKDYADDDSTQTLETVSAVTEHNCIVSERLYSYVEDETLEVKTCLDVTLEVMQLDIDDRVYRSLEDLREEVEGEMVVDFDGEED